MRKKPVVVMDLSTTGNGGGLNASNLAVMNSGLKSRYRFEEIWYDPGIGRGISFRRIRDLVQQLRRLDPDIVHFSGLQLAGFHMAIACKIAGVRNTLLTVHGFSGEAIEFHAVKKAIMTYILEPLTLLLAKRVCGVSEYVVGTRMMRLFTHKCCGVVYNLPPQAYRGSGDANLRAELGIAPGDVVAVSVGRVIRDKGYEVLAAVIQNCRSFENLKFVIVGEGDYLRTMRERLAEQVASGQVFLLGYRADVQRILSASDFFVLPSLHETLSIALLEASVEGIALVASNTGGVPEIVKSEYNGLLVRRGDVADLYLAIERVYQNRELRVQMGGNARAHVNEKFSATDIEERIDRIYGELLSMNPRGA